MVIIFKFWEILTLEQENGTIFDNHVKIEKIVDLLQQEMGKYQLGKKHITTGAILNGGADLIIGIIV